MNALRHQEKLRCLRSGCDDGLGEKVFCRPPLVSSKKAQTSLISSVDLGVGSLDKWCLHNLNMRGNGGGGVQGRED